MENLSRILDAESLSLPIEVIEEVKTVRKATQSEVEQMQELKAIAHRHRIPEEVIISHSCTPRCLSQLADHKRDR